MEYGENTHQIDFRVYIGILVFRWQTIAVCFLYALFGAVMYLNFAPRQYLTTCKLMIYRDVNLSTGTDSSPWKQSNAHVYLLQSEKLRRRVVRRLFETWGESMGTMDRMLLEVTATPSRRIGSTLEVSVQSWNGSYNDAFLNALVEEHEAEWGNIQRAGADSASLLLERELVKLEERIRSAEDDLIEYQRLNDIARVEARGSMESRYLQALMERRSQLTTEVMLLEAQNPLLRDANAAVISDVHRLTRETGSVRPVTEDPELRGDDMTGGASDQDPERAAQLPEALRPEAVASDSPDDSSGWRDLRVRLAQLELRERDLLKNLEPEHAQVRAVRKEMERIHEQLKVAAEVELGRLRDRHKALTIQMSAVESAEYKWQAKNLLASQRRAELKRIASVVSRFEDNYRTLYQKLHDMRVSEELKAEHFRLVEAVATGPKPIWPDPFKILFMALIGGLGSGLGLAFLAQTMDNKMQSIADVERVLGVPFLGGVPFWVHSGLESTVRPIVTEEHSAGAIEAYRALRTSVLSAMAKEGENLLMVSSADSREGKTLTALNLAIMIAQMGKRVLLVDMDLRRGRLHRSVGLNRDPGMTDVLQKQVPILSVVQTTRVPNLDLAPSGDSIDNASELLQSRDIKALFSEVKARYDYVILDTSPILRVTDTVILASHQVGVVLYVARVNHTPKPMIRYSLDMLKDVKVLGLIMNSIELHKISSLYYAYQYPTYAYYSNAYAYGQDYYDGDLGGTRTHRRRRVTLDKRLREFVQWLRRTFLPSV
ncbi:MAG: hypothetical protein A2269_05540 [Lentisphaerae bacterium RIFOXYA12_FULL_60_10]|nr:MAG: hypothetical protein A2269_05540 [Lentisphaerae bacterium RIFOXYA12_FULL_60_10]